MAFSIVIIQADREEAERDARRFEAYGCKVCAIGADGRDALELAREYHPDVLITEPFLPYFNCDEISDQLRGEEFSRMIRISISDERNGCIADQFLSRGGDLFLVRPLDYAYCIKRMEQFQKMRNKQARYQLNDSIERAAVRRLQLNLRMPISITGFLHLQEAILITVTDPQALRKITTDLYPRIAAQFQTSPKNVERCIRNAIEATFERGDIAMLQTHFAHFLNNENAKPSNKEFIGYLAEMAKDYMLSQRSF